MIVVAVPARNEERSIQRTLRSILDANMPEGQEKRIVACLNNCTDQTEEKILELNDSYIDVIREPKRGKAHALLRMIRHVQKNFPQTNAVVFTDADVLFHKDALVELWRELHQNPRLKAVGGVLVPAEPKTTWAEHFSRIPFQVAPYHYLPGALLAVRTSALNEIQDLPPNVILDDAWISLKLGPSYIKVNPKAHVFFHLPKSFSDFSAQAMRQLAGLRQLLQWFSPSQIEALVPSNIPRVFAMGLRKLPELTGRERIAFFLAPAVYTYLKLKALRHSLTGTWESQPSTKG